MPLTPSAAAKRAGVSRSLISRATKSGELKATKRNNGHLSIEEADLDEWMNRRVQRDKKPKSEQAMPDYVTSHDQNKIDTLTAELSAVREELSKALQDLARAEGVAAATDDRIADLSARIDDLTKQAEAVTDDRDSWKEQAQKLTDQLAEASKPRPGILSRLFGR